MKLEFVYSVFKEFWKSLYINFLFFFQRVEEFFSKDISYFVLNKKEVKYVQILGCVFFVLSLEFVYIVEIIFFYFSYDGSFFKF